MKQKTISVPLFKKGDRVRVNSGDRLGTVTSQRGVTVSIRVIGSISLWTRICTDLTLLSKKEYDDLLSKKLRVRTLDRELIVENNRLKVGCQTLCKEDALKVAAFITKNIK